MQALKTQNTEQHKQVLQLKTTIKEEEEVGLRTAMIYFCTSIAESGCCGNR